jgi:hypothetical protein
LFKTPIQNITAIRVKEQLGIRCIGEEIVSFGMIQEGTRAKVFELCAISVRSSTSTLKTMMSPTGFGGDCIDA